MNPKVFIIILNWNGYRDTIECIESLKKITYLNYEIVIVDNGSTDSSEEILKNKFPEITLIQTGENLGYTGGNNIGIRYALERDGSYIILLNNDTIVDPSFVGELVNLAESDRFIGILSPKIYFYDKPDVIWFAGAVFGLRTGRSRHIGFKKRDVGQYDYVKEIDRACGCAMMVTKNLCKEVGLMDENYFCYCEEIDWSLRIKKYKYKIVYVPASKIWHKVSKSTGGIKTGEYLYYSVRNTLRCLKKNVPCNYNFPREFMVIITHFLSLFTMRIPKWIGTKNICLGIRDYYFDKFGRKT